MVQLYTLKNITVNNTKVGAIILVYKNLFLFEMLNFFANIKDIKFIKPKPIGAKNPIFEQRFIEELHSMFSLFADPRQRRT